VFTLSQYANTKFSIWITNDSSVAPRSNLGPISDWWTICIVPLMSKRIGMHSGQRTGLRGTFCIWISLKYFYAYWTTWFSEKNVVNNKCVSKYIVFLWCCFNCFIKHYTFAFLFARHHLCHHYALCPNPENKGAMQTVPLPYLVPSVWRCRYVTEAPWRGGGGMPWHTWHIG